MSYFVFTEENEHYMEEGGRRLRGEYESYTEAVAAARRIVDSDLEQMRRPGMTAQHLFQNYTHYGTDAYVVPDDGPERFSAWGYAGERCRELCESNDEV